jgi:hypothetical protein
MTTQEQGELQAIISEAKLLARRYYDLTGKPLGITGEVGEFEAAAKLGLELTFARSPGYDAKQPKLDGGDELIQIKSRSLARNSKSGRIGKLNFEKDWHSVVLVILDPYYEPVSIYKATRQAILDRLSKLKNRHDGAPTNTKKGALTVAIFKSIAGAPCWQRSP